MSHTHTGRVCKKLLVEGGLHGILKNFSFLESAVPLVRDSSKGSKAYSLERHHPLQFAILSKEHIKIIVAVKFSCFGVPFCCCLRSTRGCVTGACRAV